MHRRRFRKTVVAILLILLGTELCLRLLPVGFVDLSPENLINVAVVYEANGLLQNRMQPNQSPRVSPNRNGADPVNPVIYNINNRGYRGENLAIPKPDNTIRVATIGGSAVFDIRNNDGEDWTSLTGDQLMPPQDSQIQMVNAAQAGFNSAQSLAKIVGDLWVYEPDIVLISHCWNDIKYFTRYTTDRTQIIRADRKELRKDPRLNYANPIDWLLGRSWLYSALRYFSIEANINITLEGALTPEESTTPTEHHIQPLALQQFRINMISAVQSIRTIGAEPVLMLQPRLPVATNEDEAGEFIGYSSARLNHEQLVQAFDECDRIMRDIAHDLDVILIDETAIMNGNLEYFNDHVHTTTIGSRTLADKIAPAIQDIIDDG